MNLFKEITGSNRAFFNKTCQMCVDNQITKLLKDLTHFRDSSIGLWCTDKPELIPDNVKHLFFRLGDK